MSKFTEADWMQIVAATHSGMSMEAFLGLVKDWLAKAKAPRFDLPYTDLVYQPMLEVMEYLRGNGFRTYIVSGGGQEFIRVYSEKVYGVSARAGRRIQHRNDVRRYKWQAGTHAGAEAIFR
jgi:phosphoserine phosphatase